jgi:hypothetical protein
LVALTELPSLLGNLIVLVLLLFSGLLTEFRNPVTLKSETFFRTARRRGSGGETVHAASNGGAERCKSATKSGRP